MTNDILNFVNRLCDSAIDDPYEKLSRVCDEFSGELLTKRISPRLHGIVTLTNSDTKLFVKHSKEATYESRFLEFLNQLDTSFRVSKFYGGDEFWTISEYLGNNSWQGDSERLEVIIETLAEVQSTKIPHFPFPIHNTFNRHLQPYHIDQLRINLKKHLNVKPTTLIEINKLLDYVSTTNPHYFQDVLIPSDNTVLCHGDYHPDNIVFTTSGQCCPIDWCGGGLYSQWFDLACCMYSIYSLPSICEEYMLDAFFKRINYSSDMLNKYYQFSILVTLRRLWMESIVEQGSSNAFDTIVNRLDNLIPLLERST